MTGLCVVLVLMLTWLGLLGYFAARAIDQWRAMRLMWLHVADFRIR